MVTTVHLKSPPVDGKANEELIKTLANLMAKSQSELSLVYLLGKLIEINTDF